MNKTAVSGTVGMSDSKMTKCQIIKNLCVICLGTVFFFTAYEGLGMLQNTMNQEYGIGFVGAAILYGCFSISSLLLPKYIITKLGSKRTLMISWLSGLPYIASILYPHWAVIIPTSIVMGIAASLMWASQATYLYDISVLYSDITICSKRKKSVIIIDDEYYHRRNRKESVQTIASDVWACNCLLCTPPTGSLEEILYSDNGGCKNIYCQTRRKSSTTYTLSIPTLEDIHPSVDSNIEIKNDHDITETENSNTNFNESQVYFISHDLSTERRHKKKKAVVKPAFSSKIEESIAAILFGIHGMAYLLCYFSENLLSYVILENDHVYGNVSNLSCFCGPNFCNVHSECSDMNLEPPSDNIRFILTGSYTGLGLFSSLIVALFLDPVELSEKEEVTFSSGLLSATFKIAKRKEFLLLIPLSLYIGMIQSFFSGDFTKSYTGCAWGTHHLRLVSICYGLSCGLFAILSGWFVKQIGRIPVFTSAATVNLATNIYLLLWKSDHGENFVFYLVAVMWGIILGTILSQLRAFYGTLFKEERIAAFSTFNMWYALGSCISFAFSNNFCTSVKIYVLLTVSSIGFICYIIVETFYYNNKSKK